MDDTNDQRDYAEENYNRHFCTACGTSPCEDDTRHQWDGYEALEALEALTAH